MENKKFYQTVWFTWIMLIIFPIVGIFLLWKYNESYSKNVKIIITIIFSILFCLSLFGGDEISTSNVVQDNNSSQKISVPREYRNAFKKAELYANDMYMSKKGIYKQLTSSYGEGFSAEEAQYAVDNIKVDWNKNALEKAKMYSDDMHMSKKAIFSQLTSSYGEGFTQEEAQYAIDNL